MSRIKRYFGSGLLVTLPVFLTLYLLYLVFRFIDGICGKFINFYLQKYLGFTIPGLGVIFGLLFVLVVGFFATNFLGRRLFRGLESWFRRMPLVRQVYPAAKQIVGSFMSKESLAFKKVVMVEYPSKGIWSVGFMTSDSFRKAEEVAGDQLLHIFIATSPTPLTGFLILVPKQNVKMLPISVEEGMKLIVSGGIVKPA